MNLDWDTGNPKGIKKKCRLRRISSRGLMEEKRLWSERVISIFYMMQRVLSAESGGNDLGG